LRLRGREWDVSSYRTYSATAAPPTDSSTTSSCDSPSSVAAVALESEVVVNLKRILLQQSRPGQNRQLQEFLRRTSLRLADGASRYQD
jgi:hypothetical protein